MILDRVENKVVAAFSGHRMIPENNVAEIRAKVRREIKSLYAQGVYVFLNGMAIGFDMLAAEEVISLKKELPYIKLVAVIPCRQQAAKWRKDDIIRYNNILLNADEKVVLSENYFRACFLKRNDYMIDHAAHLICYYDGVEYGGGTFYTYRKARTKNLQISNVF